MTTSTDPDSRTQTAHSSIERAFANATAQCITRCCESPSYVDRTLTPVAPATVVSVDLVRAAERSASMTGRSSVTTCP